MYRFLSLSLEHFARHVFTLKVGLAGEDSSSEISAMGSIGVNTYSPFLFRPIGGDCGVEFSRLSLKGGEHSNSGLTGFIGEIC